jgi:hypothetical protein
LTFGLFAGGGAAVRFIGRSIARAGKALLSAGRTIGTWTIRAAMRIGTSIAQRLQAVAEWIGDAWQGLRRVQFKSPLMEDTAGGWKSLGRGIRIMRSGDIWMKQVDPNANAFWRWWGRTALNAQARALRKLGDMAPRFLYRGGTLYIPHQGAFTGGRWAALKISIQTKIRLGTPFTDAVVRNIGESGLVFDPVVHPVWAYVYGTGSVAAGVPLGYEIDHLLGLDKDW